MLDKASTKREQKQLVKHQHDQRNVWCKHIVPDPVASCCDLLKSTKSGELLRAEGLTMEMDYYNDGLASYLLVINDFLAITYRCCCDLERS